jgi:hypothetical protein
MTVSQSDFISAILDAAQPVPDGLLDDAGHGAGKRFNVYRNNVAVSLSEALGTGFPLVKALLGQQNFDGLAGMYLRAHPPKSPLMMHYGQEFPEFLGRVEQLTHLGYLPDCARLDLALRASYHAADAPALDPASLAVEADVLMQISLPLASASIVIRSAWPLYDLWVYNTQADAPHPRSEAQDILITRPEYDPTPHLLPAGAADWLDALGAGASLAGAHEAALSRTPDFELGDALTIALSAGAFTTTTTT